MVRFCSHTNLNSWDVFTPAYSRAHVSRSFRPLLLHLATTPTSRIQFPYLSCPSCPFNPLITVQLPHPTQNPPPSNIFSIENVSKVRFRRSTHCSARTIDVRSLEFFIHTVHRINDIFAQQVSRPLSIPGLSNICIRILKGRNTRGCICFIFFLLTFNPHPIPLYPPIFRHSF